jgi:hypothetical protein
MVAWMIRSSRDRETERLFLRERRNKYVESQAAPDSSGRDSPRGVSRPARHQPISRGQGDERGTSRRVYHRPPSLTDMSQFRSAPCRFLARPGCSARRCRRTEARFEVASPSGFTLPTRTAIGTNRPPGRGSGSLGNKDRYLFVRSFRCPLAHRTHHSGAAAVTWLRGAVRTGGMGFQPMPKILTGGEPVPRCMCEAPSSTGFAEFRRFRVRRPGPH